MKIVITVFLWVISTLVSFSQDGLPLLDLNKNIFDFGRTLYMETKTQQITFKNIGDTVLTIYHIDSLKSPFYSQFHYPDTLEKGDSVVYDMYYKPNKAGRDSQRVVLRADTRLSHSIGLLFDRSFSMDDDMPGERRVSRLSAARSAATVLINAMLNTPKVKDEAAVFWFWEDFSVAQNFTTIKTDLRNALPNNTGPYTHFFDGCIESIDRLRTRPFLKVLIALTDGADNRSTYTENAVINFANQSKVKIYTIGLGSDNNTDAVLQRIANSTGGKFFDARTSKELANVYYDIFSLLSKNVELYFDVLGTSPAPILSLDCPPDTVPYTPGDTISYNVYFDELFNEGAQGRDYELLFRYNTSLILPIDEDYVINLDGTISFFGKVNTNLDSFALKTIRFMTLVGDEKCTDVVLEKIIWDDAYYSEITSDALCPLCIDLCAFDLRQIASLKVNSLNQNIPNPATETTRITFNIEYGGNYKLEIIDLFGNTNAILPAQKMEKGTYTYLIDVSRYPSGSYFYVLSSANETFTKRMIISR